MDYLREGIGSRACSQRDPLVEYQREGYELFQAMMESIKEEAVGFLFHVEVQTEQPADPAAAELERAAAALVAAGLTGTSTTTPQTEQAEAVAEDSAEEPLPADLEPEPAVVVADHRPHIRAKGIEAPKQPKNLSYSAPTRRRRRHRGSPGQGGRRLRRRLATSRAHVAREEVQGLSGTRLDETRASCRRSGAC